jgi:hypothetical protein
MEMSSGWASSYQNTRRNFPEGGHLHTRRRENLKSHCARLVRFTAIPPPTKSGFTDLGLRVSAVFCMNPDLSKQNLFYVSSSFVAVHVEGTGVFRAKRFTFHRGRTANSNRNQSSIFQIITALLSL